MVIYTVAHLNWEGDGITALYKGDKFLFGGDAYHDNIDDKIEGFFLGLTDSNIKWKRKDIYVSNDHFDEYYAPKTLTELKAKFPWTNKV